MKTLLSCLFVGMTHQTNCRVILSIAVVVAMLFCGAVRSSAQLIFTDWTSITNHITNLNLQRTAIGRLGPVHVTLRSSYDVGTPSMYSSVLDGSSPLFNDPSFTPALPQSDCLSLAADMFPDTIYTISFSSPVRNPVIHLSSVYQWVGFPSQTLSRLSGDAGFMVSGDMVLGASGPGGPDFQADGTVLLQGTFTNIQFFGQFTLTEPDFFRMQLGARPVPVLSVVRFEEGVTLRWPVFATNFVLEAATNLSPPAVWVAVTNSIETVGESFSVTVHRDLPKRFFRLQEND